MGKCERQIGRKEESQMRKRKISILALLLCVSMLAAGCGKEIDQTANTVTTTTEEETEVETVEETTEPEMTERAKELLTQNPDTVGYITVEGTEVDNPVVQTTDNDYYLSVGFDGQEFRAGTVFMDYTDVFGADTDTWSENIVLYGHNMADNTMFGSLRKYRQDPSYYKDYPFITFSSNYADYTYVMVGLVITSGDADADFPYWRMEELDDKEAFDGYMSAVKEKNMIDNPIDVQYGDSLLTLSTCYSDEDNSRFIIVLRRLREGETTDELLELIQGDSEEDSSES